MLNSVSSSAGAFGRIGTVIPSASTSDASGSPQTLKGVIEKLSNALMSGGHLSTDSPLGKMVEQQLKKDNPLAALTGNSDSGAVKKALGEVIKDKLGSNFGAAADAGIGGGQGGPDLLSQVMNGLSKSILDHALTDKGDGSTFSNADKPVLQQVADYMDKNKALFGAPDSGSWSKELDEDNYLDKGETAKFRAALDQISQQLDGGDAGDASTQPANAGGLGSPQGSSDGGGLGGPQEDLSGNGGLGTPQQEPADNGGLGSPQQASPRGDLAKVVNSLEDQLAKLMGAKNPMDIFKQGLEMGLGLASGLQSGGLGHHLQQHDLQNSAAQAAQNILDVMTSSLG
ncbi:hypothetical protein CCU68_19220 [Pseudomonas gingeri NCPPB 3146 = LMG 5327]|uniref:Harpin HrpZ n=2 Tax=Pseudomonas gingeri TaxID=117681 RepID=A0A7Y7Y5C5_9PSED|nr:hypothetical protein [Pseudomonas gingeri]NVZ28561.1 hypothetical protein [Pseudomonas gingeri]NWC18182.1 hypothetical protein [Pseudomonas gingeri]NWE49196.1 hypothetical protein [Pseudomonas gingeri]PNQ90942.1 hypothetical protein CCU68_19220 [Pseudomonas gingeri NCPPB 3146 = LMG 5327]